MENEYSLPTIELLKKNNRNCKRNFEEDDSECWFRIIEKTLRAFGIKASVCEMSRRDSSDFFKLMLDSNTTVRDIVRHSEDIKVALSVDSIRIEEPMSKGNIVEIEVPSDVREDIPLRDIVESSEFQDSKSNLTFGVGIDASGKIIVSDFEKFSSVLIGGRCWSGSSDFIDSMILSLLYKAHPDGVKFIMIDSTISYLPVYNVIPHMYMPVVTDLLKGCSVLAWVENEARNRHMQIKNLKCKDLTDYNKTIENDKEFKERALKPLHHLVIIINELEHHYKKSVFANSIRNT